MKDLSSRPGAHDGARYLDLARWLDKELALKWLDIAGQDEVVIAFEDVRSHLQRNKETGERRYATTAAHVYGGLRAIIAAWACARGYRVLPIGVGTWKAVLGCQGGAHATKAEVMRCVTMMGLQPGSQDEADAIGVAFAADRTLAWQAKVGTTMTAIAPRRAPVRASIVTVASKTNPRKKKKS